MFGGGVRGKEDGGLKREERGNINNVWMRCFEHVAARKVCENKEAV